MLVRSLCPEFGDAAHRVESDSGSEGNGPALTSRFPHQIGSTVTARPKPPGSGDAEPFPMAARPIREQRLVSGRCRPTPNLGY